MRPTMVYHDEQTGYTYNFHLPRGAEFGVLFILHEDGTVALRATGVLRMWFPHKVNLSLRNLQAVGRHYVQVFESSRNANESAS